MTDRDNRFSPLTALGDGITLLCAVAGFTLSFLSLYGDGALPLAASHRATPLDLCAAQTGSFLGLSVIFALASLCVWSLPRFRGTAAGGLAVLWALSALSGWENAVKGGAVTVRTISALFAQRVSWGRTLSYESGLTAAKEGLAARLFLMLALALLALVLGWAVVRARRWWLVLLLTLPPLLPGLLADLFPDWVPFMALSLCWCAMLLTDLCKWAAPDRRGVLTLTVLPCVAVVLAVITAAFPREGYTRPGWALRAESQLSGAGNRFANFFSQFDGPFHSTVTYVGAAEEADLANAGPLNYSGRTVLRVTSDFPARLYLRGASLAVYENGVWKALPQGTYQEWLDSLDDPDSAICPLIFPAALTGHSQEYTATVDNVGAVGSCVYAPYYPTSMDPKDTGVMPVEDAYFARRQGQWVHTLSFVNAGVPLNYFSSFGGGTVVYAESAGQRAVNQYRDYAYGHYLYVPRELWGALDGMIEQSRVYPTSLDGVAAEHPLRYAMQIAAFLEDLCEYDIEAPPAPSDADPVLYFLNESRRGYCMHFASAATLMLREMGIPARYVSGFTAVPQEGKTVDVPDRAAHAWVEVWVDGFGWYPVEVTPAAAFEWYQQGVIDPVDLPSDPVEESETPEPTPTPSGEAVPSDAPSLPPQGEDDGDAPKHGPDLTALFAVLKALAAAVGIAALIWLGQFLPKRRRAKRLSAPDRNRAALYGYGCLRRMERWGGRVDERAVELAQKARFSQHTLTQAELAELRLRVDRERERLCVVLDPLPRLAFRYLWGMPRKVKPPGPEEGQPPENLE